MIKGLSKNTLYRNLPLSILGLVIGIASAQAAGKLYKWVDDSGMVRYGDRIPPQYAKQKQDTLNEQGIVVETKAAAKTKEQIATEQRLANIAAEKQRIEDEAAAYDRVLLDTFTTEDDIILTRNGKIEAIEAAIRLTRARTEKTKQRLLRATQRAANLERSGRAVPKDLRNKIADARAQITYNTNYIQARLEEQDSVRKKFEIDLERFRELKLAQTKDET